MTFMTKHMPRTVEMEAQVRIRLPKEIKRWLALRALNDDLSIQQIIYGLIHEDFVRDTAPKRSNKMAR